MKYKKTLPFWSWKKSDAGKIFVNRFIEIKNDWYFYDMSFTIYSPYNRRAHGTIFRKLNRSNKYPKDSIKSDFKSLQSLPSFSQKIMISLLFGR